MFLTMVTSAAVGTTMPFIMKRLGADPAIAAGPFITTTIDITGLLIYFSIASLLMDKLIWVGGFDCRQQLSYNIFEFAEKNF